MNIGVEIDFKGGTRFYSTEGITIGGNFYQPLIKDMSSLRISIGEDHTFDVSRMGIAFHDNNGEFARMLLDNHDKFIVEKSVRLVNIEGKIIRTFGIESAVPGRDESGNRIFNITISDLVSELNRPVIEEINQDYWPDSATDNAYGKVVPRIYRCNPLSIEPTVRCWHVRKGDEYKYLLSSTPEVREKIIVRDFDGVDRTAQAEATSFDGYAYIRFNPALNQEYCLASVNYLTLITPYQAIQDLLLHYLPNFTGEIWEDVELQSWLDKNGYQLFLVIQEQMTGAQLLKMICDSFQLNWYIASDRTIAFNWIEPDNLKIIKVFQDFEILDFNIIAIDSDLLINSFVCNAGWNNQLEEWTQVHRFDFVENLQEYGLRQTTIHMRFLDNLLIDFYPKASQPFKTAIKAYWESRDPKVIVEITVTAESALNLNPGELIAFVNNFALNQEERIYQIRAIEYDFINSSASIRLWDVTYFKYFRQDVFRLNSNTFDGSLTFHDSSTGGWNEIYRNIFTAGDIVKHSEDQARFGTSSIEFVDEGALTAICQEDLYNIGFYKDFTADLWVYPNAFASGINLLSATGFYDLEYWRIFMDASGYVNFYYYDDGFTISMVSSQPMLLNEWNHIAFVKVGSNSGLYINGDQTAWTGGTYTVFEIPFRTLHITGSFGFPGASLDGYIDEVHVSHVNDFDANPNILIDDKIKPPENAYGDIIVDEGYRLREDYDRMLREDGGKMRRE